MRDWLVDGLRRIVNVDLTVRKTTTHQHVDALESFPQPVAPSVSSCTSSFFPACLLSLVQIVGIESAHVASRIDPKLEDEWSEIAPTWPTRHGHVIRVAIRVAAAKKMLPLPLRDGVGNGNLAGVDTKRQRSI